MAKASLSVNQKETDIANDESMIRTNDDDENKESTTLLWFDPNIGSHKDTELTKQKLRHINDYVIFHTDINQCTTFIQSTDKEKIFLITSGSKASELLPRICSLRQVDSIFIFCMKKNKYEHLLNEYSKIIGIYNDLDNLCKSIIEQIDLVDKQLQTFSFFDRNQKATKDLTKQSGEFLWFQLFNYAINRLPKTQKAKEQMIEMCQYYYRGNTKQLQLIKQFQNEYQSKDAVYWYSKQSFVYELVNKALRSEDIDQLYTFRYFIGDLSQSLNHEHEKILSSAEEILIVYRGSKLDKEEFDKLTENRGKLISTNGYLSTSRLRSKAHAFAMKKTKRTDVVSVLFQIECHVKQISKCVIFGDIAHLSEYPNEKEVLFDLNACFTIESIEQDGSLQLIKMNVSDEGNKIAKDFLTETQKETEEQSIVVVFGRLMCKLGEYDKSQKYFEQLLNDSNGEDIAWIEFNIGRALHFKCEWKEARTYYDRAYNRMKKNGPAGMKDSAYVLNNIGIILKQQGQYDEALEYYERALKIREKYYPPGHVNIAASLDNIALVLFQQEKYDDALDYHQRALQMRQKCYPSGHVDIAHSLNNIGKIFEHQRKYEEALDYYQRALQLREKFFPCGHVDTAISFNNIGNILKQQGKYNEALDYYQRALTIQEKYYPSGHVDVALTLNNIGACYEDQNKKKTALDYYKGALTIYEKFLPVEHPHRERIERNIRRLTGIK